MRTDLQRPYNTVDNPVDPDSEDYLGVLGYLKQNGLPTPKIVMVDVTRPEQPPLPRVPGKWRDITWTWEGSHRPDPLISSAIHVMNDPQQAVVQYRVWMGISPIVTPTQYATPKPVPPTDEKPPAWTGKLENDGRPGYVKKTKQTPFGPMTWWEPA